MGQAESAWRTLESRFSLSKGTQYPLSCTVHFPFPIALYWLQIKCLQGFGHGAENSYNCSGPYLYCVCSCFYQWFLLTLATS